MKLWQKLSLMTVLVLLLTTGLTGAAVLWHSVNYNEKKVMESYERQVYFVAMALQEELSDSVVEAYNEVTKSSYLNFLVRKYGADQYILLRGEKEICNLTPYKLVDSRKEWFEKREEKSLIQRIGTQHVVITEGNFSVGGSERYTLILIQDISEIYADIREQTVLLIALYLLGAAFAVILIFFFTGKILEPLQHLKSAAQEIQGGKLTCRVKVKTKDEIGVVAEAFNSMAERIEEQVEKLSAVAEQRRQMLGSLAHEMKTPMTSVIGYADTLLHVNVKEGQRERALLHICEESRRLERLGSKLMKLIGMYDNDSILLEKTDMAALFVRVEEMVRQSLEQKEIRLRISCRMEEQRVDRDLMESLLVNLIDNAVKASKSKDTIFLEGKGNTVTVRDQGCGIAAEELARVTEAFYMVDKARGRKAGGCGLGLSLCSRIAQLHGARLVITSEEGKGTSVSVQFEERKDA